MKPYPNQMKRGGKKITDFLKTQNLHTDWVANSLGKPRSCSSVIKMMTRLFPMPSQQCRDALIWNNYFYIACKIHHRNCKKTFYKWQNLLQAKSPICSLTPSKDNQTLEGDVIQEVLSQTIVMAIFSCPKFSICGFSIFSAGLKGIVSTATFCRGWGRDALLPALTRRKEREE